MILTNSGSSKRYIIKLLVLSGLVVGTLDISAACIDYYIFTNKGPETLLRFIASGVFGNVAFTGSNWMVFWGLFFHYTIAFSFTFLFYILFTRWRIFRAQPVITAILYAVFMWAVTTQIILPLSNVPPRTNVLPFWKIMKAILILLFMISVPLTLIMNRYSQVNQLRKSTEN